MPGRPKTGADMKLYRNTGTQETPVWVEICDIGDLNVSNMEVGLAEIKRRCSHFIKNLPSLFQSFEVEFNLLHGVGHANFNFIRSRFFQRREAEYAIMDGDIEDEDSQGLRLPALVAAFPWQQNLEDVSDHAVRLATAYMEDEGGTEIDPSWYIVGGDSSASG